jgi:hypothetical protein
MATTERGMLITTQAFSLLTTKGKGVALNPAVVI